MLPTPKKINPDLNPNNIDLTVLNEFKSFLEAQKDMIGTSITREALKVINNLRFIKVNEEFITYAVSHPEDEEIYHGKGQQAHDKSSRTLRDLDGGSFHFIEYAPHQAHEFWAVLLFEINKLETDYLKLKEKNRLVGYTHSFKWEENIGCLVVRLESPAAYAKLELEPLDKLVTDAYTAVVAAQSAAQETSAIIKAMFEYASKHNYFDKLVTLAHLPEREITLTRVMFAKAIEDMFRTSLWEEVKVPIDVYLPQVETVSWQDVSEIIKKGDAVVKVITYHPELTRHLDFLVDQLENPGTVRPISELNSNVNRENPFDPITQKIRSRTVAAKRGAPKDTPFPKKTAHSLLPSSEFGNMFNHAEDTLIFLYQREFSDLKEERFTSLENMNSNNLKKAMWHGAPLSSGFIGIRLFHHRTSAIGNIPNHAESVHSSPRQALRALGTGADTLRARVNLIWAKQYILQKLYKNHPQFNMPLFIAPKDMPRREYTENEQLTDLLDLAKTKSVFNISMHIVMNFDSKKLQELISSYNNSKNISVKYKLLNHKVSQLKPHSNLSLQYCDLMLEMNKINFYLVEEGKWDLLLSYASKMDATDNIMRQEMIDFLCRIFDRDNCHLALDQSGETLLHYAIKQGCLEMVLFILKNWPETSSQLTQSQQTIIHIAANSEKDILLKYLCGQYPELIDSQDEDGNTALHIATRNNKREMCEILLAYKANIHLKNHAGETVLFEACRNDVSLAFKYMQLGLKIDETNRNGMTPITFNRSSPIKSSFKVENEVLAQIYARTSFLFLACTAIITIIASLCTAYAPRNNNTGEKDTFTILFPWAMVLLVAGVGFPIVKSDLRRRYYELEIDSKFHNIAVELLPLVQFFMGLSNSSLSTNHAKSNIIELKPLLADDNDVIIEVPDQDDKSNLSHINETLSSQNTFPFPFAMLTQTPSDENVTKEFSAGVGLNL